MLPLRARPADNDDDRMKISKPLVAALVPIAAYAAMRGVQALALRRLRGKVVVVTGGSRGLGLELARQSLAQGARVAICSRHKRELNTAVRELAKDFGEQSVYAAGCDVTDGDDAQAFINDVNERFGGVDLLINNAGIIQVGPVELMNRDDYDESIATHFWGPFNTINAALPSLTRRRGRIVNITSIGGKISIPHLVPYAVGKFALVGFSQGLSAELAKDGIHVTTAFPGLMRTGSARNAWFKGQHRKEYGWFSIGSSLPLLTVSVQRAAYRILSAAMLRQPQVLFPFSAHALLWSYQFAPRAAARVLRVVNRLLPQAGGIGERRVKGSQSTSNWSPSILTKLGDLAAKRNNELGGRRS
jgi:NAD(P)-dependent dehydrogenase (short-subunit alcohol dehydrogenase family)